MRARDYRYFDAPFVAMAHRGGSLLSANVGRENTLEAFANAVGLGYRYLETDVHTTSDGVLVAFHDDVLDRVTDTTGRISELSFDRLREVSVGGARIPTLDELLDAFPDARFNIDIKAPGAVEPLARTIAAHRAQERVCVASFSIERLAAFRRLAGTQIATSMNPAGVGLAAFVPLLPGLLPSRGVAYQMPVYHEVSGRRVRLLTPALLDSAHRAGRHVHIWTVNDATEMEYLIDLGVDGLITDAVDVLKDVAIAKGVWVER